MSLRIIELDPPFPVGHSYANEKEEDAFYDAIAQARLIGRTRKLEQGQECELSLPGRRIIIEAFQMEPGGQVIEMPLGASDILHRITHLGKRKTHIETLPPSDHVRLGEIKAYPGPSITSLSVLKNHVRWVVIFEQDHGKRKTVDITPHPSTLVPVEQS